MPILSDTNCSPTLVQLTSLESSITSGTDTLSAESQFIELTRFFIDGSGFCVCLGCKNLELSVFPKEDIS